MRDAQTVIERLGLLPHIRKLKALVLRDRALVRPMRFPTYDLELNRSLTLAGDYFRYATIGLALQRVLHQNIEGNLAEVGVYRGEMSTWIHKVAPDRRLYLFDTFEGFPTEDLEPGARGDDRFSDTTVETVLERFGHSMTVSIRKGYVPDTFRGLENQQFAFVLLDLDLYRPTSASLEFFYPRLSRGGYIFVHDYNSPESNSACKRALDEFMTDKPELIVEIADEWGTALLRRS